jgi:predicted PurR-regulated permease PerM
MTESQNIKKTFAGLIVIILSAFTIYSLLDYVGAFVGAIVLYIILKPLYLRFIKWKIGKGLSALLVILISVLVVLVPLVMLLNLLYSEVGDLIDHRDDFIMKFEKLDERLTMIDLKAFLKGRFSEVSNFAKSILSTAVSQAGKIPVSLMIMGFLLYYLLTAGSKIKQGLEEFIPFSRKHAEDIIHEFRRITTSTIVTSGVVGLVQGSILSIGFLIAGIKGAIFWGFIGGILSFIPMFGPFIIWIPLLFIEIIGRNYFGGITIGLFGAITSTVDNFIRPIMQQKTGNIHPLVSLLGVFIGIPAFGLAGLIIGPLLLSYLLLTVKMFKEEYLKN